MMRKSYISTRYIITLSAMMLIIIAVGCGMPLQESDGYLVFPDFTDFRSIRGGIRGEIMFGEEPVGGEIIAPLRFANSGKRALTLNAIELAGEGFGFLDRNPPDFPINVPPGESRTVYLGFYPERNGLHEGMVAVRADGITRYILMNAIGVWEVKISLASADGQILEPVEITEAGEDGERVITSIDGHLQLAAEANFLRKFSRWETLDDPKSEPIFSDELAAFSSVFVSAHTHIQGIFENPWVFFPKDYLTLQDAVNAVKNDDLKEGVIIENGVHDLNENVLVPGAVSIYGGFAVNPEDFRDRQYRSAEDRENPDYQGVLRFTDPSNSLRILAGGGITIEGLTIKRSVASHNPLLDVRPGGTPILQYNTIVSNDEGLALRIDRAAPHVQYNLLLGGNAEDYSRTVLVTGRMKDATGQTVFENNEIRGGNTTSAYSRVYTVDLYDTDPVFFRNSIISGSAGGSGSRSYAMYIDWQNEPHIVGNQISGGAAAGSDGETYGIYFINNGKATIRYNSIDAGGGSGTARAIYSAYGTNLYLRWNNLTATGNGSNYGIYLGANGRVRRMVHNGLSGFNSGLQYRLIQDHTLSTIDELNNFYNTNTNTAGSISINIPDEAGKQEWDE